MELWSQLPDLGPDLIVGVAGTSWGSCCPWHMNRGEDHCCPVFLIGGGGMILYLLWKGEVYVEQYRNLVSMKIEPCLGWNTSSGVKSAVPVSKYSWCYGYSNISNPRIHVFLSDQKAKLLTSVIYIKLTWNLRDFHEGFKRIKWNEVSHWECIASSSREINMWPVEQTAPEGNWGFGSVSSVGPSETSAGS
jgi:hypothetical protein